MQLILCSNQNKITEPYLFKATGIKVYSFEEALYHTYSFWKQSLDDFLSEKFIVWIRDTLKLTSISNKIESINKTDSIANSLCKFLSVINYLSQEQIMEIKAFVTEWENQSEWVRIKDKADYLLKKGETVLAYKYYTKVLTIESNVNVLNNTAIALMKLEKYEDAEKCLLQALEKESTNINVLHAIAENYIYSHKFEQCIKTLNILENLNPEDSTIYFLHSQLNNETGNYRYAVDYLEKAMKIEKKPFYIYKLSDTYLKLRQFDKAITCLDEVENKNKEYYLKKAEVYSSYNNIPAAIKNITEAIGKNRNDWELWYNLAIYNRLDYDLIKAEHAIIQAINISSDNPKVLLEKAHIKKAQGKIKDYQIILNGILNQLKENYRESNI